MTIRDALFGPARQHTAGIDAGLLLLRLFFGLALAFGHGLGKLPPSDRFTAGVDDMGFPVPILFAWAAGMAEFGGGVLIALGLLTRPAAVFVAFNMLVAVTLRHAGDSFADRESALSFAVASIAILLAGGGRYALDALFRRAPANDD